MLTIRDGISRSEQDFNDTLIKNHSKQCIMPDTMFSKVNQRVRFVPKHGKKKDIPQPLVPMRMYVVHDTIEIISQSDDMDHYSAIDKPTIKVIVETSNHPGTYQFKF